MYSKLKRNPMLKWSQDRGLLAFWSVVFPLLKSASVLNNCVTGDH